MSKDRIQSGKPFCLVGQFGMFYYDSANKSINYYSGDLKGQWYADVIWWGSTRVLIAHRTGTRIFRYEDIRI